MTHLEERQRVEIDRLRAELAESKASARATQVCADRDWNRAKQAEARLAAVIDLCDADEYHYYEPWGIIMRKVRDAATGETPVLSPSLAEDQLWDTHRYYEGDCQACDRKWPCPTIKPYLTK